MDSKLDAIVKACDQLAEENRDRAVQYLRSGYPFEGVEAKSRRYTPHRATRIFVRDGFLDLYSGQRLIFPGALRLLSHLLPQEFPFHPHGKMSACHMAYWELAPSLDHVDPISRGGKDEDDNIVTTSMLKNAIKANWTLEELNWERLAPGNLQEWDGLLSWFQERVRRDPQLLKAPSITTWDRAAAAACRAKAS